MLSSVVIGVALVLLSVSGVSTNVNIVTENKPTTFTYPRNISDVYKGTWSVRALLLNETTTAFVDDVNSTAAASASDAAGNVSSWRTAAQSAALLERLGLSRSAGDVILHFTNTGTQLSGLDSVQGDLVIRNGFYSTVESKRFTLQGVYFWQIGAVFLVANPAAKSDELQPLVSDFTLDLESNRSLIAAFVDADLAALHNLVLDNRTDEGCYFTLILRVEPVPADFNDRYAYLHEEDHLRKNHRDREDPDPLISLNGVANSLMCGVSLKVESSSMQFGAYYTKAINYVVMVSLASVVQIMLLIRQMDYTGSQARATRVSLLTIGHQAAMDSYLCLLHLTAGVVVQRVFNAFATAAFFKFVTFSVFEMRYLLTIWKARHPQEFAEFNGMRRQLSVLYSRFYGLLLVGFLVLYTGGEMMGLVTLLMFSFWLPQIFCNASRDTSQGLMPQYVIGMSITRLLIPLYFLMCDKNFLHVEPNPLLCYYLIAWVFTQAMVLLLQDHLGPRFFIPAFCLPAKYDYGRRLTDARIQEGAECVICMSPIDLTYRRTPDYMVTPCPAGEHVFHRACLLEWMREAESCPVCRAQIPPPTDPPLPPGPGLCSCLPLTYDDNR